jgi:hypothetical protein
MRKFLTSFTTNLIGPPLAGDEFELINDHSCTTGDSYHIFIFLQFKPVIFTVLTHEIAPFDDLIRI